MWIWSIPLVEWLIMSFITGTAYKKQTKKLKKIILRVFENCLKLYFSTVSKHKKRSAQLSEKRTAIRQPCVRLANSKLSVLLDCTDQFLDFCQVLKLVYTSSLFGIAILLGLFSNLILIWSDTLVIIYLNIQQHIWNYISQHISYNAREGNIPSTKWKAFNNAGIENDLLLYFFPKLEDWSCLFLILQ